MKMFTNFKKPDFSFYKNASLYFIGGCILFVAFFIGTLSHFYFRLQSLNELEKHVAKMQVRLIDYKSEKQSENDLLQQLENCDPLFIKNHIENIVPLETEIKKLQALTTYTKEDREKVNRLRFLETNNRIEFVEGQVRQHQSLKESELSLKHPIEVDGEDLKKLLSTIEQTHPNSPQLVIKEFELKKKTINKHQDVYLVDLNIIKREKI